MNRFLRLIAVLLMVATANAAPATAPSSAPATQPGRELNLLGMGDWGEGKPAQKKVAGAMAAYVAHAGLHFDGLLSAGDNFYVPVRSIDDPVWQNLFENMYDARRLDFPFYIALGNHDYDMKKYLVELQYAQANPLSRWKLPSRWYRLDLPTDGPCIATILMLDSDHDFMSPDDWADERQFLETELAKPRGKWTICCAHHPLFSNGIVPANGILQHDWGTLFDKYKVDIYFCGHEHNLQHLEYPPHTTSLVLAGGGGAHAHPMARDKFGPFSRTLFGFVHFELTPDLATVHYIDSDDHPVHVFERAHSGKIKIVMTTPSDPALPLESLQRLVERELAGTRPSTRPTTGATTRATTQPAAPASAPAR